MAEIIDRICEFCGKSYRNEYKSAGLYSYTIATRFCSRACSSLARVDSPNSPIKKDPGKEAVENEIREFIRKEDRYCSREEILEAVHRSNKTLRKHGISTTDINTELGHTRKSSLFQSSVGNVLKQAYGEVEEEKTFEGLTGKTGHPLRVDFFLPEINTVVEADGLQHSDPNHTWATFKNGSVKEYDAIKEQFCKVNNIRLVRIPYKKRLKSEEVLSIVSAV